MTAEIAIINRHAIALAADSAVTVGQAKVWTNANKLFSLGPRHDIAIMVYGSGDYLGLDWELVVKEFRRHVVKSKFRTVAECSLAFKNFLESGEIFTRTEPSEWTVLFPIYDIINGCDHHDADEFLRAIKAIRKNLQSADRSMMSIDHDNFVKTFTPRLKNFIHRQINSNLTDSTVDEVVALAEDFLASKVVSQYSSGVVVAGFGSDEYHPVLYHHIVDGCWDKHIRWWDGENCKNLNTTDYFDELPIVPFAQDDMPFQFLTGISNEYLTFLSDSLGKIMSGALADLADEFVPAKNIANAKARSADLSSRFVSTVMDNLYEKVREDQVKPISRRVSALPKEEMALMAESLVELTSLKRKVDSKLQSVSGPVDVAVISKGDGFVWIKRKYYFDREKNGDFFSRRSLRENGGEI